MNRTDPEGGARQSQSWVKKKKKQNKKKYKHKNNKKTKRNNNCNKNDAIPNTLDIELKVI